MNERLLYTALDSNNRRDNINLAWDLAEIRSIHTGKPINSGYKINLDHVLLWGMQYVKRVQRYQSPVFVDLKMNNGSRTMSHILEELVKREVRHVNVWAIADKLIKPLADITRGSKTELLGVTVTTHFDDDFCQKNFGRSLRDSVRHFSKVALENGCDGIILPGTTLEAVKDFTCTKLVPAIRPTWFTDTRANDQEQSVTPTEAIQGGANTLVCGTPIRRSPNPREAMIKIYEEMLTATLQPA